MAVTFDVTVTDEWALRMRDPVENKAFGLEGHNVVQKILAYWGVESVDELSPKEKGELVCLFHLWNITQQHEVEVASNAAYQEAAQAAIDDF